MKIDLILKKMLFLIFFTLILNVVKADNIKVGIEPDKYFTTLKLQSISGKWQIHFYKTTASGTISTFEEIHQSEDIVLMLVPKGIVMKMASVLLKDEGYDKIVVKGGEIISLELPQLPPKILQETIEITHDKTQLYISNIISLDNYIISCSSSEILSCETESVKAGIITIATKANYLKRNTKHSEEQYDVCDNEHCIKFMGKGANRDLIELLYPEISNQLLYYNNNIIYPRYHHTCGGKTSSAKDVYGIDNEPYHIGQSDLKENKGSENCFHSPSFHWNLEIPISSIEDFLSIEFSGGADKVFDKFEPIKINSEGRILMVRILGRKTRDLHGIDFMKHFQNFYGKNSIKSMRLYFEPLRRSLIIRGMGEGDGVGMCLYGADGLAKKQVNYKDILNFYYPGTIIK